MRFCGLLLLEVGTGPKPLLLALLLVSGGMLLLAHSQYVWTGNYSANADSNILALNIITFVGSHDHLRYYGRMSAMFIMLPLLYSLAGIADYFAFGLQNALSNWRLMGSVPLLH